MKKVTILSAAALMLSLAIPQFAEATNVQNKSSMIQVLEVQYQEITVADLPEAVSTTLTKDYAGYTTDKVFLGNDGNYKIAVNKDEVKEVLFFDATGVFVKAEKPATEGSVAPEGSVTPEGSVAPEGSMAPEGSVAPEESVAPEGSEGSVTPEGSEAPEESEAPVE